MTSFEKQILETSNYKRVYNCCSDALAHQKFIAVIGGPGYGKTSALLAFRNNYPNLVSYIRIRKSMNPKIFYHEILSSQENIDYNASLDLDFLIRRASIRFSESGVNKLLIIDEASKMSPKMFEYLHAFRDDTDNNTGIILAGVEYFKSNMESWVAKSIIGMPEVFSRISSWQTLKKPTKSEYRCVLASYNITESEIIETLIRSNNYRELTNKIMDYITVIKAARTTKPEKESAAFV